MANTSRKATNLSIDRDLLSEAKALNINLSRAAEGGVKTAVRKAREDLWKSENAEAIDSSNAYVDKHGLPLDQHRPC